jgi:hypothetical protein
MKNKLVSRYFSRLLAPICAIGLPAFLAAPALSQTAPAAQTLPYTQNFGTATFTNAPLGMAVWNGVSGGTVSSQALAEASVPTGNATLTAATAAQSSGGAYGYAADGNAQLYIQTSGNATNGVNQPVVAVDTTGQENIVLSYDISVISAQPRTVGVVAQYRVGTSGVWSTLTPSSGLNPFSQTGGTTGLKTTVSATLPLAANNQPVVQIRWALWRGTQTGNSSGIGLDNISVSVSGTPSISPNGSFVQFSTFAGTASASQSIGVAGSNLTAAITATAPTGIQVSSDGVSFGPTASLPTIGGTLYARVAASAPGGEIASSITLSSAGATDLAVPVTAAVRPNPVPLPYGPETFTTSSFPWYTFTVAGNYNWTRGSAGGNSFMEINGYTPPPATGAVPSNAWLILGPFNFPAASNLVASFNLQRAFNAAGSDAEFTFKYSTDYAGIGDPSTSTWSDIPFTKPAAVDASSTVFSPSGAIALPPALGGQTGVYLAFQLAATSPTATSRWRMDDFEVFTSSLPVISVIVNPSTINEGSAGVGTVSIPEAVEEDVIVTVTSADPTLLLVDNTYGDAPAASCEVPIFAGETSAIFNVTTTRDFTPGADVPVQVTADSAGYTFGQTIVTVRNIDLPATSLTAGGYTQSFAGFTSATLPEGWSLTASNQAYSEWSTSTTGAKYSSASVNVFGYQHTGTTGVVQQVLTLKNDTGDTINDIVVSYVGRVARITETRTPAYSVTVNGTTVPALAYSTASGADATVTAAISGLSVAPNQTITIVWTSDRGFNPDSGSSRQIGIGEMSVTVGSAVLAPSVAGLTIPLATIGQTSAEVSADVTADGGAAISSRGFVYALTSVNPNPEIGGTGVTDLPDATAGLGVFNATLSGLTIGTQYSVRAYAINAEGTSYTAARTFVTLGAPIEFTGNYAESFASYTGTLPAGWTALSSLEIQSYGGAWGTGSAGGFRGVSTNTGAVLGYQHTAGTGTLTVTARFVNDTASPITTLYVRYLGRVARADQENQPAWAVSLDGNPVAELDYSTGNTAGPEGTPADELITAAIPGLNIAPGAEFNLTWVSNRGTQGGTSRQIGLANFQVSTSEIGDPSINVVGSLTQFATTEGTASASQSVSASGANLIGNITVTAPANYEVSLDNTTFSASVTLTQVGGTVASTPVYVRIAASAPVGNPAGQVSFTSPSATAQTIAVTGTVSGGGSAYDTWAGSYGLNPATNGAPTADPDGDSFTNAQEYAFGTSPIVANGALLGTTASGGNLVVTWLERSDVTYNVQSTANLATTPFANDGTVSVVNGPAEPTPPAGYTRKQFTVPTTGAKFYRVRATTP